MSDLNISISSTAFKVLQTEASYRGLSLKKLAEKVLHHYVTDYPRSAFAQNVETPESELNVSSTHPGDERTGRSVRQNKKTSYENAAKFIEARASLS